MSPVWSLYIEPFIRELAPGRVMLIGAQDREGCTRLLEYCRETGCRADIIEPRPGPGVEDTLAGFPTEHVLHRLRPIKGAAVAEHPDLVVMEGEPNWWTVTTALNLFRMLATQRGRQYPFVLVRHTAWPYGRRDMYPTPERVDERRPFSYQGLDPDQPGLVEDGINSRFAHAIHEGGPQNGVLTAIEGFLANATFDVAFWSLPYFNGLGVVAPRSRMTPGLGALIESFFSPERLLEAGQAVELEAARVQLRLAQAESRLERRTRALERARGLIAQQQAEIGALNKRLARQPKEAGPSAEPPAAAAKPVDPATQERLALELAEQGRAEDALAQLQPVIARLPDRAKGWRAVNAVLKAAPEPEARADVWRACLAFWTQLAAQDQAAAQRFGADLAARLFPSLAEMVQFIVPAETDTVGAAWRMVRRLYADPAFGELAARHPAGFADFVRVAGEDRYIKAEGKHGANLGPCVYDALEMFAAPAHREQLLTACRTDMAAAHGGLNHASETAGRLLEDPEFQRPLIICGFHHSGTRLLARQLAALGVKQQINVYQYEWRYVIQLNALLEPGCLDPSRLGSAVEGPEIISPERLAFRMAVAGLEPGRAWGFKDPRNGLTAETWLKAFPHARLVHLVRDPVAAIGTLPEVYDQFVHLDERRPTRTAFWSELWEAYVQGARRGMASADAAIEIRFEELCADPTGVLARVAKALGLQTEVTPERLAEIPVESGKADLRDKVRERLPGAEFAQLEALAERYGYARAEAAAAQI